MIRDYDIVDSENGVIRKIEEHKDKYYDIKELFKYNIINFEIMPRGLGEYMSIKDNIKEELMKMIIEERKNINTRLEMNGDVYEIACEGNFLDKLEKFVKSI